MGAVGVGISPVFLRKGAGGAGAANGLLNNLIGCWPGNEASGDLLDVHTNALHLTDTNTVTNSPGKVYSTARQYTRANSEYHTRSSHSLLQTGDVDFTLAQWWYLDDATVSGTAYSPLSKWEGGANLEYMFWFYDGRASVLFRKADNSGNVLAAANTFGVLSAATWYFVLAYHDATSNECGISINNGAFDTTAITGGVYTSVSRFEIGRWDSSVIYFAGRIGPTAMWKSAAGGGGVLTADQRTALYNGGAGLPYASFTL